MSRSSTIDVNPWCWQNMIPALEMMHIAVKIHGRKVYTPTASYRMDWRKVVPEIRANELQKNPHSSCNFETMTQLLQLQRT